MIFSFAHSLAWCLVSPETDKHLQKYERQQRNKRDEEQGVSDEGGFAASGHSRFREKGEQSPGDCICPA